MGWTAVARSLAGKGVTVANHNFGADRSEDGGTVLVFYEDEGGSLQTIKLPALAVRAKHRRKEGQQPCSGLDVAISFRSGNASSGPSPPLIGVNNTPDRPAAEVAWRTAAADPTTSVDNDIAGTGDPAAGTGMAMVAAPVAAAVACLAAAVGLVVWVRRRSKSRAPDPRVIELHSLLMQTVQAEFLLTYRQLIGRNVNSFDDYRRQIDVLSVAPKSITLGAELGRGNYGKQ